MTFAFVDGRVITGDGRILERATVLVEHEKIVSVAEAGTRVAAQVMGLEKKLGTIEEGKLADIVLVRGNPLDDVELLLKEENIRFVMKGGQPVKGWQC
jgi:imidazolonepropionase-like amidohydrolase